MSEDFVDGTAELSKRTIFDHDDIACLESEIDLRSVARRAEYHPLGFFVCQWSRFRPAFDAFFDGNEVGYAGGVSHNVPAVVVHDHVNEKISGVHGLLDIFGFAIGHLDDGLLRHDGIEDLVFEVHGDDSLL